MIACALGAVLYVATAGGGGGGYGQSMLVQSDPFGKYPYSTRAAKSPYEYLIACEKDEKSQCVRHV